MVLTGKRPSLRDKRCMNCHGGNRSARCSYYRQLRSMRNVPSCVDIFHRSELVLVDYESAQLVSLAPQLRAQIVGWILADREVEPLTVERHLAIQLNSAAREIL